MRGRPERYDRFFESLQQDISRRSWPFRHPTGQNYALLGRPPGTPSFVEWHMDLASENTGGLRVQLYLGNHIQRRGRDPLRLLEDRADALREASGFPDKLSFERWTTRAGVGAQRLAVYLPGAVEEEERHTEFREWLVSRMAGMREGVGRAAPDLGDAFT